MSTITGDGRFKWASHRIAEYYYNHLDHRLNQYRGPADTARDNFVQAVDLEGVERVAEDPAVSVPVFVDDGAVTYVRISTDHYQRLPVTYVRDIVLVKNQFLVVKDRVRFNRTMKTRVGPCWQARSLGPTCGEHWFNCYYQWLCFTGLALGRSVQSIHNPNYDLLVYFSPREGRRHVILDRTQENVWRCSPVKLRQEWAGMPEAGQEVTFTTVLLPHAPTQTPETYAEKVKILQDDDASTAVRVIDPRPRSIGEAILVLNEPGRSVELDAISTDARMALVLLDGEGKVTRRVVCDGTRLSVNGADEMSKAVTYTIEPFFTAGQEDN